MKRILSIGLIIIGVIVSGYCEMELPEGAELADTNLWTPFVDVLRIRETPDLNGKVIATIKLGEHGEYIRLSDNESEVDYNGEKIKDKWIQIKLVDGHKGWAWRGFMVHLKRYTDKKFGFEMIVPDTDVISLRVFREEVDEGYHGAPFTIDWIFDAKTKVWFVFADPGDQNLEFAKIYYLKRLKEASYIIKVEPQNRLHVATGLSQYFSGYWIVKDEFEEKILNKVNEEEKNIISRYFKLDHFTNYYFDRNSENKELIKDIVKKYDYYYSHLIDSWNNGENYYYSEIEYERDFLNRFSEEEKKTIKNEIKKYEISYYKFLSYMDIDELRRKENRVEISYKDNEIIRSIFKKYNYNPVIEYGHLRWLDEPFVYGGSPKRFITDIKSGKGSYYAAKWYGSSAIVYKSVKIYK